METLELLGVDVDGIVESKSPLVHFLAGALAGTMEHCGMFPVDTIKVSNYAFRLFKSLIRCFSISPLILGR
jgi:hypothetical protein